LSEGTSTEAIAAAYRDKLRQLNGLRNDGEARLAGALGAAGRNGLSALREHVAPFHDELLKWSREAVVELATLHGKLGETDAESIAESIQTQFIDVGLANMPAAGHYVSMRGLGTSAVGERERESARHRFDAKRGALRGGVKDLVVIALAAANPKKTRGERLMEWWNKSLFAALLLIFGSISGAVLAVATGFESCAKRTENQPPANGSARP
jgi:hypothetical protein